MNDVAYSFLILLSNISFFLAFSILSSAKFAKTVTDDETLDLVDGTQTHIKVSEELTLKYDKFASLEFTMIVSVLEWIFSVALVLAILVTQLTDAYPIPVWAKGGLKRGCVVAVFFGYTAAVAVGAMASSCVMGNDVTIADYDKQGIQNEITKFCNKVSATSTFVWIATLALGAGVALKHRAGAFEDPHFGYGAEGSDPNYGPSSAYAANRRDADPHLAGNSFGDEEVAGAFHESPGKDAGGYKADEGPRNSFGSATPPLVSSADL